MLVRVLSLIVYAFRRNPCPVPLLLQGFPETAAQPKRKGSRSQSTRPAQHTRQGRTRSCDGSPASGGVIISAQQICPDTLGQRLIDASLRIWWFGCDAVMM